MVSPQCMAAVGLLTTRGKPQGVAFISKDAGAKWTKVQLKEFGRSLFLLTDRLGWMVTEGGIWRTGDCGATWEKVSREKNLTRIHFLDENRGFAAGAPKKALETSDGGRTWKKIPAADEIKSDAERSVFTWVDFITRDAGFFIGWHEPRRWHTGPPAWMDPEDARYKRQLPSLRLMLQTLDGGKTWRPSASSIFGRITRLHTLPTGRGIALVEFEKVFRYPSEVFEVDLPGNKSTSAFRDSTRAITDVTINSRGVAYLAGYETPGGEIRLPIPGKLKVLRSTDMNHWEEMLVDYRAIASRALVATATDGPTLVATDTGMILRLTQTP